MTSSANSPDGASASWRSLAAAGAPRTRPRDGQRGEASARVPHPGGDHTSADGGPVPHLAEGRKFGGRLAFAGEERRP